MKSPSVLFGGSRFIFCALAPFLVLSAVAFPFTVDHWLTRQGLIVALLELAAILLLLAIYDSRRFDWAARALCLLVFIAYVGYFVDELIADPSSLLSRGARSGTTARNALAGLLVFGVPAFFFAIRRRATEASGSSISRADPIEPS